MGSSGPSVDVEVRCAKGSLLDQPSELYLYKDRCGQVISMAFDALEALGIAHKTALELNSLGDAER